MKKRFLPFGMLLAALMLIPAFVNAQGKYVPREDNATAQDYFKSIRANQATGLIDPSDLIKAYSAPVRGEVSLNWTNMGPDNIGSLTRGIVYDNQDPEQNTVIIGTLGGSIFKTVNGGITWKLVGDVNMMVSSMVQDENGHIYVGTGDGRTSYEHNGLSQLNYETSFRGTGVYKSEDGEHFVQLEATVPTENNTGWQFVNELSILGSDLYAATNGGLMISHDGGTSWTVVSDKDGNPLNQNVRSIKTSGSIKLATMDEVTSSDVFTNLYVDRGSGFEVVDQFYGYNKVIAISPSDNNYVYIALTEKDGRSDEIWFTKDGGETWELAMKKTSVYDIFAGRGNFDFAMTVHPKNPRRVFIGGENLWVFEDKTNDDVFVPTKISDGMYEYTSLSSDATRFVFCHYGIQNIVFGSKDENSFYVGTEGGVFKAEYRQSQYSYKNTNRYFVTPEQHTSVARLTNIGVSGYVNRVTTGNLDYGTVLILGDENVNNITTGTKIYPNDGIFSYYMAGGPSAISTIDGEVMFVTIGGKSGLSPVYRTENKGEIDYDMSNFNYNVADQAVVFDNADAFRTPILLEEIYNNVDTSMYSVLKNRTEKDTLFPGLYTVASNTRDYPLYYNLDKQLLPGDSVIVADSIASKFFVATKGHLRATRDALFFDEVTRWHSYDCPGLPTAIAQSSNGDIVWVGTAEGTLHRYANFNEIVYRLDTVINEIIVVGDTSYDTVITIVKTFNPEITDSVCSFAQAITSISVNPNDASEVLLTLGNYGNSDYVFLSENATDAEPEFVSIQNNLPAMPVYSSVIARTNGMEGENYRIMVGTDNGLYYRGLSSEQWFKSAGMDNVPVMDLKQQMMSNRADRNRILVDEVGDTTLIAYPGIKNQGMIYAATYGRGAYKCDNYCVKVENAPIADDEDESVEIEPTVSVYPNPVRNNATVSFEVNDKASVNCQIYDLGGRLVKEMNLGTYPAGNHTSTVNLSDVKRGAYILRLQSDGNTNTTRIVVY